MHPGAGRAVIQSGSYANSCDVNTFSKHIQGQYGDNKNKITVGIKLEGICYYSSKLMFFVDDIMFYSQDWKIITWLHEANIFGRIFTEVMYYYRAIQLLLKARESSYHEI